MAYSAPTGPVSELAVPDSVTLLEQEKGTAPPPVPRDLCHEGATTTVSPGSSIPLPSEVPVSDGSTASAHGTSLQQPPDRTAARTRGVKRIERRMSAPLRSKKGFPNPRKSPFSGTVELEIKCIDEELGHLVTGDLAVAAERRGRAAGDDALRPEVVDDSARWIGLRHVREMDVGAYRVAGVREPGDRVR